MKKKKNKPGKQHRGQGPQSFIPGTGIRPSALLGITPEASLSTTGMVPMTPPPQHKKAKQDHTESSSTELVKYGQEWQLGYLNTAWECPLSQIKNIKILCYFPTNAQAVYYF